MERWNGTYAVVTGVSAGIGAAIAENFIKLGINVRTPVVFVLKMTDL